MADVATISLEVRTSDLERGTQKLKEFGDTAEKVSSSSRNLNDQFNRGVGHQKKISDAIKKQREEFDNLLNSINPTNKAFQKLDEWQAKLASASKKGIYPSDEIAKYNQILEQTRDKLTRVNMSLTAEGRALLAQEAATNRAKQAADDFLNSLKNQTEIIGKTRTEILELKAAQLGVSQQAAPMINKLKEQEKAFMNGSITIGQYKQAMRQLPMQMTDIVTSLASGMPVWMVMIQQGGQIKDSFGGIGNSLKALASIITPTKIAIATATTASLALAYSAYKGSQEFAEFNKQLIMTGRYAGKTAYELNQLSKTLVGNWITQGDMASALTKVVGSGRFQGDQILLVARAAAQMEQSTGKSIDETINQFKRLKDDPVNAILELDKTLHLLTASEYEHIKSLEIAGKTQEASEFSIKKLSEETDRRTRSMNQNIGSLERAWNDVATAIKNAGNALKNIGKPLSDAEALAEINDRIKEWENAGFWHGTKEQRENMIRNLKEQQKILSFVVSSHEGYEKAQNKSKEADEKRKESIREYNKLLEDTATNAQKRTAALNKLWEQVRKDPEFWTEDKRKLAVQNINNKFKDRTSKTPTYRPDYGTRVDESANQALLSLQAQLKVLKEHKTVSDVISSERKKLWDMEAKISILEEAQKTRQLTKDEKALLAKKDYILASQEALAIAGDDVELQKQKNRELDQQNKWMDNLNAKIKALREGAGLSSRLQQRESALNQADTPEKKDKLKEWYAEEDAIRANWELGVKKGFAEFQDQATNVYGNVAQITQSTFQGMSNTVADFFLTAKFNITDFTRSFLEMTTKMLMQMAMLNAMKAAFGGNAVGNFFGFASGGYTGDGGKHDPAGVVHKGEFVFTKEATQRLGVDNLYRLMDAGKRGYASGGHVGGSAPMSVTQPTAFIARNPQIAGGGVNVTIDMSGVKIETEQQQSAMPNIDVRAAEQSLKNKVKSLFISEGREGGDLYKIIKAVSGNR